MGSWDLLGRHFLEAFPGEGITSSLLWITAATASWQHLSQGSIIYQKNHLFIGKVQPRSLTTLKNSRTKASLLFWRRELFIVPLLSFFSESHTPNTTALLNLSYSPQPLLLTSYVLGSIWAFSIIILEISIKCHSHQRVFPMSMGLYHHPLRWTIIPGSIFVCVCLWIL